MTTQSSVSKAVLGTCYDRLAAKQVNLALRLFLLEQTTDIKNRFFERWVKHAKRFEKHRPQKHRGIHQYA